MEVLRCPVSPYDDRQSVMCHRIEVKYLIVDQLYDLTRDSRNVKNLLLCPQKKIVFNWYIPLHHPNLLKRVNMYEQFFTIVVYTRMLPYMFICICVFCAHSQINIGL